MVNGLGVECTGCVAVRLYGLDRVTCFGSSDISTKIGLVVYVVYVLQMVGRSIEGKIIWDVVAVEAIEGRGVMQVSRRGCRLNIRCVCVEK